MERWFEFSSLSQTVWASSAEEPRRGPRHPCRRSRCSSPACNASCAWRERATSQDVCTVTLGIPVLPVRFRQYNGTASAQYQATDGRDCLRKTRMARFRSLGFARCTSGHHPIKQSLSVFGSFGMPGGIVATRCLRKSRKERHLSQTQLPDGSMKVMECCSLNPVRSIPEVDGIQVEQDDFSLLYLASI